MNNREAREGHPARARPLPLRGPRLGSLDRPGEAHRARLAPQGPRLGLHEV